MLNLPQPRNSTPDGNRTSSTQTIGTSSNNLFTTLAFPNTDNRPLDAVLSAEGTTVGAVLGDFNLAEEFTEGGSVAGAVFTGDSDFLGSVLSHVYLFVYKEYCGERKVEWRGREARMQSEWRRG